MVRTAKQGRYIHEEAFAALAFRPLVAEEDDGDNSSRDNDDSCWSQLGSAEESIGSPRYLGN